MEELKNTTMNIIKESIRNSTESSGYTEKLTVINTQMKLLQSTVEQLEKTVGSHSSIDLKLEQVKQALSKMTEDISEYDDRLVRQSIDMIKVRGQDSLHITFKDGFEYTQSLRGIVTLNIETT